MSRLIRLPSLLLAAVSCALATAAAAADNAKPVRVLFVLGSPPYHDIRTLPPILEKALGLRPRFFSWATRADLNGWPGSAGRG